MVDFVTNETTSLRYFIPLMKIVKDACLHLYDNNKLTSPYHYELKIRSICKKHNIEAIWHEDSNEHIKSDHSFTMEGVCIDNIEGGIRNVLTYMTDYIHLYDRYKSKANNIFLPNEQFATEYGKTDGNNVYLGSPKYAELDDIPEVDITNYILVLYPKIRDIHTSNIDEVMQEVSALTDRIIIKYREKDPPKVEHSVFTCVRDIDLYPHDTMKLLYNRVALVINFDSTSIKEALWFGRPVLNLRCKPARSLEWLYKKEYGCLDIEAGSFQGKHITQAMLLDIDKYKTRREVLFGNGSHYNIAEYLKLPTK